MVTNFTSFTAEYTVAREPILIKHLKEHRKGAFEYLYNNYSASLYTVILQILCEKQLSEDVLQESFVKIWTNIRQYDASKSRLYTWMHKISRNCAIDMLRSKQYKKNAKTINGFSTITELNGVFLNMNTIGLRKIVNTLPPEFSDIITLSYFSGYTQEEIAEHLSLPVGTVKTKKRVALTKLRHILHKDIKMLA